MSKAQDTAAVIDQVMAVLVSALDKIKVDEAKIAEGSSAVADVDMLSDKVASLKASADALSAVVNPPVGT